MAWTDAPPTAQELGNRSWNSLPPTKDELSIGEKQQGPGKGQTFLEHAGNAMSFGYLPHLQAAAEGPMTSALNAVTGNSVKPDDYLTARDANIQRLQDEKKANPKTALAGDVTGGIVGAAATPLPELGIGGGLIGSAAKGSIYGAGQGALSNPGDEPGKIDPIQLQDRGDNAARGAKFGALMGTGSALAGKGLNALSNSAEAAQGFANNKAVKAAGGMLKDFRSLGATGRTDSIGQFALDNGLVKAGDTVEDVAQKATAFNKAAGQKLENIYSQTSEKLGSTLHPEVAEAIDQAGFNPVRDKALILNAAKEKLGDSVEATSALAKLQGYLDDLGSKYGDRTLDPKKANEIKGAFDEAINYSRNPLTKQPGVEQAFSAARNELNNKIAAHIEAIGNATDGETADALRAANKEYGYSAQLKNMAKDKAARESANRAFGLTDTIAAGSGAGVGGLLGHAIGGPVGGAEGAALGAAVGGGVNKLARTYGPGIQAAGANLAAKGLNAVGKIAAPIGDAIESPNNPITIPNVTRGATEAALLNKKKNK